MLSYLSSFVYTDNVTKMTNRLKNDIDHINVDKFIKMLKDTDSVIAGSYPLQVYHNETWEGSDIDIFTTSTKMKEYMDKKFGIGVSLKSEGSYYNEITKSANNKNYNEITKSANNKNYNEINKSGNNKNYNEITKNGNNKNYNEITKSTNTKYLISELINYNTPKIKVQLIIVTNIEKISDITQNFDFDFCKTTFDGEEFNITDEGKNKIGNYVQTEEPSVLRYFRLIKYEKRGFTVLNRDKFNHTELVKLYKRNL
jgi:hypothetical protein